MEDEESVPSHTVRPLMSGNPCRAYVPDELDAQEVGDTLELTGPGSNEPVVYHSWASIKQDGQRGRVRDIFLTGQVSDDA